MLASWLVVAWLADHFAVAKTQRCLKHACQAVGVQHPCQLLLCRRTRARHLGSSASSADHDSSRLDSGHAMPPILIDQCAIHSCR